MTVSIPEIEKELRGVFVDRELFAAFQAEMRADLQRLEEGQRRLLWGVLGVLVTVVVQVVVLVVQRGVLG